MDPHLYVEKMSDKKGNLEKCQKLTRKFSVEKRGQFERNDPNNYAQSYYIKTVKRGRNRPPTDYSKWYRIQSKGKLEIGISLVRLTVSINRFLAKFRKHQNDRVRGEFTSRELRQAAKRFYQYRDHFKVIQFFRMMDFTAWL